MDDALGYVVLNGTKGLWVSETGDESRSWYDAMEWDTLAEANAVYTERDARGNDTYYVLAIMPTP